MGATMRALRLHGVDGDPESNLAVDEIASPEPSETQVLVDIRACGLCGDDLRISSGELETAALPLTLGHEAAGVVARAGSRVADWQPGDRVAIVPASSCGACGYCSVGRENLCAQRQRLGMDGDGCLADLALASGDMLVPIPEELGFAQAAITTDAVATSYHALKRAGVGEGVVISIHGLGGLGMHALQLAQLAGAAVIGVDVDQVNLERALEWGADQVVDARDDVAGRIRELTDGGVDRALELAGTTEAYVDAVRSLRPGGRATIVGARHRDLDAVPGAALVADELEVTGSSGCTPQDVGELFDLVAEGRLDLSRSVTAEVGLDDAPAALRTLATREGHPIRTVVTPR